MSVSMATSEFGAAPLDTPRRPEVTAHTSRRQPLSVTARFALVLLVVLPGLVIVSWRGEQGISSTRGLTNTLFNDIITTQHASAAMVSAMAAVHTAALTTLATRASDPDAARQWTTRIANELIPRADADVEVVRRLHGGDAPDEQRTIATFVARWQSVRALWNAMVVDPPVAATGIAEINRAFDDLTRRSQALVARETRDGTTEFTRSAAPYRTDRRNLLLALLIALVAAIGAVAWLYRGVLPRARRFSTFATQLGDDGFTEHLETSGNDELATLGRALDEMATRRRQQRDYDRSQQTFAESMQLTENESEAHRMLKRHLELSIPDSEVVILNRNNSQDRLEAVTAVEAGSPLERSLVGAVPRSCIAVRQARTHAHDEGEDALLQCSVCSDCAGRSTCTPFLVGGEVIGSVLLTSGKPLDGEQSRRIRDSVVQAAPVLANLRNLAIAYTRAATDSLTGLPNRRSIDANVMRMVAHAGRSAESIAVLLLDLDHFKQVNDRHGHSSGD